MKKLLLAFVLLPLVPGAVWAQAPQGGGGGAAGLVGNAANGKAYWERKAPRAVDCENCHGPEGKGGFGPDLAGRGLSAAQVLRAVRRPWGVMPMFVASQISAQEAADVAAYFATLPKPAQPDDWNVSVPEGAPPGQVTMITMGCGQCHGENFNGPRNNMGAYNFNFDYFQNLVYNHTTAMPQYRAEIGNNATNLDMGNFNRNRITVNQLRQIYFWARDEKGVRAPMGGQIAKGEQGPNGITYPITITNNGVVGRGVIAQGLTVKITVPAGHNVVAATGPGYQGVAEGVATWRLPRSAPKDQDKLSITLNQPVTQAANFKGTITWASPGPKAGPNTDAANINGAPL